MKLILRRNQYATENFPHNLSKRRNAELKKKKKKPERNRKGNIADDSALIAGKRTNKTTRDNMSKAVKYYTLFPKLVFNSRTDYLFILFIIIIFFIFSFSFINNYILQIAFFTDWPKSYQNFVFKI